MNTWIRLGSAIALLAIFAGGRWTYAQTQTQTIYKCVDASGNTTYQDHRCKPGSTQTQETLSVPTPSTPPTPFEKLPTALSDPPTPPPPPPEAPPPEVAKPVVPPIWFCTRPDDDSHYVSHDGQPPTRWVPAGILGFPRKGIAKNYGAGGGAGVSAPGVNRPKTSHNREDKLAGDYVEIQDDCVQGTDEQSCENLRDELDGVEQKLRRAFKDERAVLEPRQTQLRHDLEGC